MLQLIKTHRWAILLAFISALIIAFPQIYFRFASYYQGIEIMGCSDEDEYLAQIQEVRDGYFFSGNPYLKEGKQDPYLFQPLGPLIVAFLGKLFSLDLNNTVLFSRLLFSFLDFWLIYIFVFLFSRSKPAALTSAILVMLGSILLSRTGLFQILKGMSPRTEFLIFSRPIIPALSIFFFFGFLISLWLFLEKKKYRWGILSAFLLGLSFYLYFYTWTFLSAFSGILFLVFLLQKNGGRQKRQL